MQFETRKALALQYQRVNKKQRAAFKTQFKLGLPTLTESAINNRLKAFLNVKEDVVFSANAFRPREAVPELKNLNEKQMQALKREVRREEWRRE